MAADLPLNGVKVLVTRPDKQSERLNNLIAAAGGEAMLFPVIAIQPLAVDKSTLESICSNADLIIFISSNAVECFCQAMSGELLQSGLRLAAVGEGTAKAMKQNGLAVDLKPALSTGSEGLLALAELQQLNDQQIVIVRGRGGRELLADTLSARGAKISYIETYERILPVYSKEECQRAEQADYLVCTSVAGVDNLCKIMAMYRQHLMNKPLVVLSERIRQHALSLGFKQVLVTCEASDDAIVQRLIEVGS